MKIGILSAITEEIAMLQEQLKNGEKKSIGGRDYFTGYLFDNQDIQVTLVFSGWGKVASASTTATLINLFQIEALIFTGVAASVNRHIHIGDVVIGERLYQHDMDARPIFAKYQIPLVKKTFLSACKHLTQLSNAAAQEYLIDLKKSDHKLHHDLAKFTITSPTVHTGIIATGDKFMRSQQQIDDIFDQLDVQTEAPYVFAVEMEGAAVAQVCEEHQLPFCVIRTISDYANSEAAVDFSSFIHSIARHYSYEIVKKIFQHGLLTSYTTRESLAA